MSKPGGLRRFIRFAAVGAVGTLAHYALLLVLVEGSGASPLAGATAGFVLGAVVNYTLARLLVFDSDRAHAEALPRFFVVAAMGLGWTALLMTLFVDFAGLHYLAAQVVTTALLLLWHYAGNALWTFHRRTKPAGSRSPARGGN
ncbi:GtrA family protein [Thauera sinica]|uniref:GtrA family protein n=1 Tax=Thauera sinica TaxID=2665146 RepID=A0ABW1AUR1_9RHOO|nr:GtrA family protein [Thauera sp. K11]ATE58583.1 polysaccharide biosynthesis protein GtrA [Thauera sp. K11]